MDDDQREADARDEEWDRAYNALALAITTWVKAVIARDYPDNRHGGFAEAKELATKQFDDIEAVIDQSPWTWAGTLG